MTEENFYYVLKRNGRLWVVLNDVGIYTPPDFLRNKIVNRSQLEAVCVRLNSGEDYADVIREFETSLRPDCND